jgi:hypothetical protein
MRGANVSEGALSMKTAVFSIFAALVVFVPSAHAQARASAEKSAPTVAVGVSFLSEAGATGTGIAADLWLPPFKTSGRMALGVVGTAGFNHFEGATEVTFAGGVRAAFTVDNPKVHPFVQGEFGIVHCCGGTDKIIGPGGGVAFDATPTLTVFGEYNLRRILDPLWANELRFGLTWTIRQ